MTLPPHPVFIHAAGIHHARGNYLYRGLGERNITGFLGRRRRLLDQVRYQLAAPGAADAGRGMQSPPSLAPTLVPPGPAPDVWSIGTAPGSATGR